MSEPTSQDLLNRMDECLDKMEEVTDVVVGAKNEMWRTKSFVFRYNVCRDCTEEALDLVDDLRNDEAAFNQKGSRLINDSGSPLEKPATASMYMIDVLLKLGFYGDKPRRQDV